MPHSSALLIAQRAVKVSTYIRVLVQEKKSMRLHGKDGAEGAQKAFNEECREGGTGAIGGWIRVGGGCYPKL